MSNAADYGFLPSNNGDQNAAALQRAVNEKGTLYIDKPGIYDISETILLGDDTSLVFGAGVYLRRAKSQDGTQHASYVFINEGAYTRTYNNNISIIGLHLICNGMEASTGKRVPGVRGHISFYYANNVTVKDFTCLDLGVYCYALQISTFENFIAENCHIEGHKDAIHLGVGDKFVIRHCRLRTYDDPIALNAADYSVSNPQLGWIQNGIIEDCYDLDAETTTGFFCRLLGGSWVDWHEGMEVMHSDAVMSEGRIYRVFAEPDGKFYKSYTRPTHKEGAEVLDGIRWEMTQDDTPELYNAGCRNIHFKDIHLQKKRNYAINMCFETSAYCRSYMTDSEAPKYENIIFENIMVENEIEVPIATGVPTDSVKIVNSNLGNGRIVVESLADNTRQKYTDTRNLKTGTINLLLSGVTFKGEGKQPIVTCSPTPKCNLNIVGSAVVNEDFKPTVSENINVLTSDIELIKE